MEAKSVIRGVVEGETVEEELDRFLNALERLTLDIGHSITGLCTSMKRHRSARDRASLILVSDSLDRFDFTDVRGMGEWLWSILNRVENEANRIMEDA